MKTYRQCLQVSRGISNYAEREPVLMVGLRRNMNMQDDIELLFEGVADKVGKIIAMTQAAVRQTNRRWI